MATVVPVPTTKPPGVQDDDEAWLYGDAENKQPAVPGAGPTQILLPKDREDGEMSTSEPVSATQSQEKDDDDDDSDDDVQVTIGDIKAFPVASAAGNLFKPGGTYQKQPVITSASNKAGTTVVGAKGVDVDGVGQVNGISLYEFSLDSLRDEDKPWRKPGADITDYFNYGFNEETWRRYCQKQTRIRMEIGTNNMPKSYSTSIKSEPDHHNHMRVYSRPLPQAAPTTIAVLGSTAASRRPAEEQVEQVQTIGTLGSAVNKPPDMGGMGLPPGADFSMPPPGMPPMPPPGFSPAVPPPGMPVPSMFSHPPPGTVPPPFFPSHMPPPAESPAPPMHYDPSKPPTSYPDKSSSSWDHSSSSRDTSRYDYKRDRSPGSGYSSGGSDDYRYSSRSRDSRGDYSSREFESRDYYRSRDSDRSRDRERDRSRSKSRDRDRRHRDRDRDDKKSKRKIKDEPDDSDYYKSSSSKHKKSKRSKRDKDDDKESEG